MRVQISQGIHFLESVIALGLNVAVVIEITQHELLHVEALHFFHELLTQHLLQVELLRVIRVHVNLPVLFVLLPRCLKILLLYLVHVVLSLQQILLPFLNQIQALPIFLFVSILEMQIRGLNQLFLSLYCAIVDSFLQVF